MSTTLPETLQKYINVPSQNLTNGGGEHYKWGTLGKTAADLWHEAHFHSYITIQYNGIGVKR